MNVLNVLHSPVDLDDGRLVFPHEIVELSGELGPHVKGHVAAGRLEEVAKTVVKPKGKEKEQANG